MKKTLIIFVLILLSGGLFSEKTEKRNGFYLELFYGQSFIDPADLNLFSVYNDEYYDYYHNYYLTYYNNAYVRTTSSGVIGEINKLKKNNLFGGRLKYSFSSASEYSKWAVSIGFKYFNGKSDSNLELTHSIDSFYSGVYSLSRKSDPSRLYTEAYVPQIGVHYSLLNSRTINLETNISAGLIFARCGIFEQYYYNKTEPTGYIDKMTIIQDYKGNGTGLSLDAGVKLETKLLKQLSVFIEGGYSYQKINSISGDALYKRSDKDNNMDGYMVQYNWSGDWVLSDQSFGNKPDVNHGGLDQSTVSDFSLDLSGFYLKVGLSIKLF